MEEREGREREGGGEPERDAGVRPDGGRWRGRDHRLLDHRHLPPLPLPPEPEREWSPRSTADDSRRRAQSLMIGGIITLSIGVSMGFLMRIVEPGEDKWAVGIVPSAVGIALLLCAFIVRPRQGEMK